MRQKVFCVPGIGLEPISLFLGTQRFNATTGRLIESARLDINLPKMRLVDGARSGKLDSTSGAPYFVTVDNFTRRAFEINDASESIEFNTKQPR